MAQIKLFVYSRKNQSKDGSKSWINFSTTMNLVNFDEREKGVQHFRVDVVFKDKEERAKIEKMKGRILVTVEDTDLTAPTVYRIRTEKDKDGKEKKKYPTVFINHIIEAVESPVAVSQSLFAQDQAPAEADVEEDEDTPY